MADRGRSMLATVVGFLLLGLIAMWAIQFLLGAVFGLVRLVLFAALIGGLVWAWLALKAPDD
jgi:hypothetical protein